MHVSVFTYFLSFNGEWKLNLIVSDGRGIDEIISLYNWKLQGRLKRLVCRQKLDW